MTESTLELLQRGEGAPEGRHLAHPRAGFMRENPGIETVGFDLATGNLSQNRERLLFGDWEEAEGFEADADLGVLRSLRDRAVGEWRGMAQTLLAIADDDDPALNDVSRLKTAARVIKPKLDALIEAAQGELARVDASIADEETAVAAALKPADPAVAALHSDIRAHWKAAYDAQRANGGGVPAELALGILKGTMDDDTLKAIATAPPYMTGMSEDLHSKARALLAARVAPDRVKRINALRTGKARALQALSALDRTANRLIDFNQAAKLAEKERRHG